MREFEFRGWDKIKKIMYNNICFDSDEYIPRQIRGEDIDLLQFVDMADCEIMQYTGKRDKKRTKEYPKGQKIYRGDILKYDGERCKSCGNLLYPNHKPYVMKWIEQELCFEASNNENFISPRIWNTEMEIIGNEYETPKLLED